jgi:hypothetical protein
MVNTSLLIFKISGAEGAEGREERENLETLGELRKSKILNPPEPFSHLMSL